MRVRLTGAALVLSVAIGALPATALQAPLPSAFAPPTTVIPVEFWCSPGFEPRRGACVATLSRDELFIYDTDLEPAPPVSRRHHRPRRRASSY